MKRPMLDLNIAFLDLYKRVDCFIRDAYASDEGVGTYITQMERYGINGSRFVTSWDHDLAMLKRLRWVRNRLSHDVGFDADICERADYDWLTDFSGRLFSAGDPLSVMRKAENAQRERQAREQRQRRDFQRHQAALMPTAAPCRQPQKETFWQRIKRLFGR